MRHRVSPSASLKSLSSRSFSALSSPRLRLLRSHCVTDPSAGTAERRTVHTRKRDTGSARETYKCHNFLLLLSLPTPVLCITRNQSSLLTQRHHNNELWQKERRRAWGPTAVPRATDDSSRHRRTYESGRVISPDIRHVENLVSHLNPPPPPPALLSCSLGHEIRHTRLNDGRSLCFARLLLLYSLPNY